MQKYLFLLLILLIVVYQLLYSSNVSPTSKVAIFRKFLVVKARTDNLQVKPQMKNPLKMLTADVGKST